MADMLQGRRLEGIAGADRIAQWQGGIRRATPAAVGAVHAGAGPAVGDEDQPAARVQPAAGHLAGVAAGVEQGQVFLAGLDQVRMTGEGLDPAPPEVDVRLRVEAHVGIQADQAPAALAPDQRQQGVGHRCHHQGIGADVQPAYPPIQRRQVFQAHLAVGAALAAELVLRRAAGVEADHRQGGRGVAGHQEAAVHAFFFEHPAQPRAQVVAGQPAKQRRLHAQPAQADGDVERRAAGDRGEAQLVAARSAFQAEDIEKGLATHQVHADLQNARRGRKAGHYRGGRCSR
ncbi:hypothetical protein PAERUG_P1_London_28_IMP_1_04_05_00132 [Pseudomonas aeruginosa]|nr:hypothetical protein PAERUG_P1_London_28_IMP_1_04_05_00132 [Pseudomonas aeruginosa]